MNIDTLEKGTILCIASRPGLGKTTLVINIANDIAKKSDKPILYFSLESSKEQLEKRLVSDSIKKIADVLTIDDIDSISEKYNQMNNGLSLIVIDYLQLILLKDTPKEKETIEKIKRIKDIAVKLDVPIILVSQLSLMKDRKPTILDLNINEISKYYQKVIFLYKDDNGNIKEVDIDELV